MKRAFLFMPYLVVTVLIVMSYTFISLEEVKNQAIHPSPAVGTAGVEVLGMLGDAELVQLTFQNIVESTLCSEFAMLSTYSEEIKADVEVEKDIELAPFIAHYETQVNQRVASLLNEIPQTPVKSSPVHVWLAEEQMAVFASNPWLITRDEKQMAVRLAASVDEGIHFRGVLSAMQKILQLETGVLKKKCEEETNILWARPDTAEKCLAQKAQEWSDDTITFDVKGVDQPEDEPQRRLITLSARIKAPSFCTQDLVMSSTYRVDYPQEDR